MKEFLKDLYEAMGGRHLSLWLVQIAVWAIIILALPMATWLSTQDAGAAKTSFNVVFDLLLSPFLIYFANFYVFGPILFFADEKEARAFRLYNKLNNRMRYLIFALCNLIAIPLFNSKFFMLWFHRNSIPNMPEMTTNMWIGFFGGMFMFFLLNCIVAAIAIGIRHFIRTRQIRQQLKDEQAKHTEAELAWLKNQINPHFLFNTLNNISSLTQIDPDAAQDAIAQLSDLLRYAMYETNKKTRRGGVHAQLYLADEAALQREDGGEDHLRHRAGCGNCAAALHLTHRERLQARREQQSEFDDRHPSGTRRRQYRLRLRQHELSQGRR